MTKLDRSFYLRDPVTVAKELLGKYVTHCIDGNKLIGKITETEAYGGATDKACHSYAYKRTERNKIMYGIGGFSYVYLIYGIYCCFNVVTEDAENPSAVLIRAIEPVDGIEQMSIFRFGLSLDSITKSQTKSFSDGPGKLCKAMNICRVQNGMDLCGNTIFISESDKIELEFEALPRVNIDYAEEHKLLPWRFKILKK